MPSLGNKPATLQSLCQHSNQLKYVTSEKLISNLTITMSALQSTEVCHQ